MTGIHDRCAEYGRASGDYIDYVQGANIAAFIKVADAMLRESLLPVLKDVDTAADLPAYLL